MKVLVTGAGGFIGSAIVERLLAEGHEVVACARSRANLPPSARVTVQPVDLGEMLRPEDWRPLLGDVDGVVNAAGILRERRRGEFDRIHREAPLALARACAEAGIRNYVQISALGEPADGEFVASKHRLDEQLVALDRLTAIVLRPSVVVSKHGSYGGTSMLRALAALPGVLVLPGSGAQPIQPLWLEDLAELTVRALEGAHDASTILEVAGPDVVSLAEYLRAMRRWLRVRPARVELHIPGALTRVANRLGDLLRAGPLGRTMGRMLERGNVATGRHALADAALGRPMQPVMRGLAESASFVQDRWQARLYPLVPLAWLLLIVIWTISGISGLTAAPDEYAALLSEMGVPERWQAGVVLATSLLNLALAAALALRRNIGLVLGLMLVSVLAYTLGLGLLAPGQWLAPTGGLLKNLGLVPLLLMMMVLENRR